MSLQPQEETGDAVCEFDAQLLKRALSNLLGNAATQEPLTENTGDSRSLDVPASLQLGFEYEHAR